MKYLIINGCAHKGNTWKLAEIAKSRLLVNNKTEISEIHLADLELPFCTGCSNCFRKGSDYCPHKSIMNQILYQIAKADGVIIVSAAYIARETGLLKNLLDHMAYMLHRPIFFNKKALIITSVGGVGGKSAAKSIAGTLTGIGFNKCYKLSVMTASWNAYVPSKKTICNVQKLTAIFDSDVAGGKLHYPSFSILIPYNLFRGMGIYYAPGTKYETEDGTHWTDPSRSKRVYAACVPLTFIHRIYGELFFIIGKAAGKHMIVTYKK